MEAENFINNLLSGKKKKPVETTSIVDKLYEKPPKEKADDKAHFDYINPGYIQQADLLFLPNDKGNQYALVVTDQGSRKVDAEPLKSKTSIDVLKAFQAIYKRSILAIPKQLTCDSGSEFHGEVIKGLAKLGIDISYGVPGSHRMLGLVERKNQTIGSIIHKLIVHDQIASGNDSSAWVEVLPTIVKAINHQVEERMKTVNKNPEWPKSSKYVIDLLKQGDKVRVALENPMSLTGDKLHGKFRSSDIRWNPKIRTIQYVLVKPGQPIMYSLDGDDRAYTRTRLQLVSDNETKPEKAIIANDSDRFEVEKILDKKSENKKVYYLVKWRGYPKSEATYELKSELIKEIPQMIASFEAKLKK